MPDVILAALVGGAIGLVAASIPLLWGLHYERYKRALNAHRDYLAWLRGIIPECEFIIACIDQLLPTYQAMLQPGAQLVCPTKRLNSDFLAAARLGVMKHPRSIILFPRLTDAYRDVVHGNDMMGRFEDEYQRAIGLRNAAGAAGRYPQSHVAGTACRAREGRGVERSCTRTAAVRDGQCAYIMGVGPRLTSNQALERTAARRAFTFYMIKSVQFQAERALSGVRSASSR